MKKKFFSLLMFLVILSTFFVGGVGCVGSKDKDKDKSSSSAKTSSSTQDTAAPPAASKK